ncbi:MAG TPA: Qat anti-phage system associated protein QatB [Roseiflexaceae bacterium]|nr:Qat anti-phage system associated protein QatB [Roseiflexaceae bacterium]
MGTSQSSKGPPSGVPMVPSWVPDPPPDDEPLPDDALPPDEDQQEPDQSSPDEHEQEPEQTLPADAQPITLPPIPVASPGRFAAARRCLAAFARSGGSTSLRRGLGHYVRRGYGGSATATRRFGSTASTASALFRALAPTTGQPGERESALDPALMAGRSVQEVMGAVVEAVRPADGTQDAEANRAAIRDALSDVLTRFPEANFFELTADQRAYAIERYVAADVSRRFELDLGKTIQDKAQSVVIALSRLKEARDYVKEVVAAAFRKLRNAGKTLTTRSVNAVVRTALTETFQVFEGYLE